MIAAITVIELTLTRLALALQGVVVQAVAARTLMPATPMVPASCPGGTTSGPSVWDSLFGQVGGFSDAVQLNGLKLLGAVVVIGLVLWVAGHKGGRGMFLLALAAIVLAFWTLNIFLPHEAAVAGCAVGS